MRGSITIIDQRPPRPAVPQPHDSCLMLVAITNIAGPALPSTCTVTVFCYKLILMFLYRPMSGQTGEMELDKGSTSAQQAVQTFKPFTSPARQLNFSQTM